MDRLLEPRPGSLRAKLHELRTFAVARLTRIRELLARPENIAKAHEALAEQVGCITLEPVSENGKRSYLAHGEVDFFGEEAVMAHSGGAGGQNRTGYARLFRAGFARYYPVDPVVFTSHRTPVFPPPIGTFRNVSNLPS
jgi:hypothetical protein